METVKDGLTFYAYYKTYSIIFTGIVLLISAIAFLYNVITGNYQKSPSSKVGYYTITNLIECTQYEITNNLCKLQLEYSDGTNIYKNNIVDSNTPIGNTTVFYKEQNPKSYMVTSNPYIFPGGFSFIACMTLIIGIVRLMIIRSNSNVGAIIGGLDATNDIVNIIKK